MLARHSAIYGLSRVTAGAVNLLMVAMLTRLMTTHDYGLYTSVVASAMLANVVGFRWLQQCLLRFWPAFLDRPEILLSNVLAAFAAMAGLATLIAAGTALVPMPIAPSLVWLTLAVTLAFAWSDQNLELVRSQLAPWRYGMVQTARSVVTFLSALFALRLGFGVTGVLIATAAGRLAVMTSLPSVSFRMLSTKHVEWKQIRTFATYGLPLAMVFALQYVISTSDRLLLAALRGVSDAGTYAVGYDLAQQTIVMAMTAVNLAAYPLAVRAYEKGGVAAAQEQVKQNGTLLLFIGLPATIAICILAPNVSGLLLGRAFRAQAVSIIPLVAVGVLFGCLKAFYFDLAFQLSRATRHQVYTVLIAAIANALLNLLLIPRLGVAGAAWATVVSYVIAMITSYLFGRRHFSLQFPTANAAKIVAATLVMAAVLVPLSNYRGWGAMAIQIGAGSIAFGSVAVLLDVMGLRERVVRVAFHKPSSGALP